jgi:hypothetical protein
MSDSPAKASNVGSMSWWERCTEPGLILPSQRWNAGVGHVPTHPNSCPSECGTVYWHHPAGCRSPGRVGGIHSWVLETLAISQTDSEYLMPGR